jgi:hypothetical protein
MSFAWPWFTSSWFALSWFTSSGAGWPWVALALLGAYHGLNPAMGWLFALALGLQEQRRSAVIVALLPIALGHAVAIALTILLLRFLQQIVPMNFLKWVVAAILFSLGVYRIFRASHPKGAGMRVGGKDLFIWSFLMASAHGAGLMILPILMSQPMAGMEHNMGAMSAMSAPGATVIGLAVLIHTVSMLVVAGILALLFFETYEKSGLQLLRHAWLNFDLLWAIALLVAGCAVLFF